MPADDFIDYDDIDYTQPQPLSPELAFELAAVSAAMMCISLPYMPHRFRQYEQNFAELRQAARNVLGALDWLEERPDAPSPLNGQA